jgi:hypothetical protein
MNCHFLRTSYRAKNQTNFLKTSNLNVFLNLRLLWKFLILILPWDIDVLFSFIEFITIKFIHPLRIFLKNFFPLKQLQGLNLFIYIWNFRDQLLNSHLFKRRSFYSKALIENRSPLLAELFIIKSNFILNQWFAFFNYIIIHLHCNQSHFH